MGSKFVKIGVEFMQIQKNIVLLLSENLFKHADHRFQRLREHRQSAQEVQEEVRKGEGAGTVAGASVVYEAFCQAQGRGVEGCVQAAGR
jgi:hypothetical protein